MMAKIARSAAPRLAAGAALVLLSVAASVWTLTAARVDARFSRLEPIKEDETDIQKLTAYSVVLDDLLEKDPHDGVIRKRLATVWAKLGQFERALADLERATVTNNTPDGFYFKADMYDKLGNLPRAVEEMHKAIVLNPTNPHYNPSHLRLLSRTMEEAIRQSSGVDEAQLAFGNASRNWFIRAPHDKNAYLFLGNHYVNAKNYLQSYRSFLIGLSQAPYMTLNRDFMIEPRRSLDTIGEIVNGNWAKAYRGLP